MIWLYFLIGFIACLASGAAGAWGMRWHTERSRVIAEREDPRDTQIRDLLAGMKVAKDDVVKARTKELDAKEHVDMAHARIVELQDAENLTKDKLANCEDSLEKELEARELSNEKLKAATQQLENLKQRNQEMEMELSVGSSGDMLDPLQQTPASSTSEDAIDPTLSTAVEDDSPSLIQCLTSEMERWKRHCHVLGEELKSQRDRPVNDEPATASNGHALEFDELTDIKGIGAVLARKLHQLGIYTFDQLLSLSEGDHERAEMLIPDFARRMQRDDWISQARTLQQDQPQNSL